MYGCMYVCTDAPSTLFIFCFPFSNLQSSIFDMNQSKFNCSNASMHTIAYYV